MLRSFTPRGHSYVRGATPSAAQVIACAARFALPQASSKPLKVIPYHTAARAAAPATTSLLGHESSVEQCIAFNEDTAAREATIVCAVRLVAARTPRKSGPV